MYETRKAVAWTELRLPTGQAVTLKMENLDGDVECRHGASPLGRSSASKKSMNSQYGKGQCGRFANGSPTEQVQHHLDRDDQDLQGQNHLDCDVQDLQEDYVQWRVAKGRRSRWPTPVGRQARQTFNAKCGTSDTLGPPRCGPRRARRGGRRAGRGCTPRQARTSSSPPRS